METMTSLSKALNKSTTEPVLFISETEFTRVEIILFRAYIKDYLMINKATNQTKKFI
jgi:hypothetical protein